MGNPIFDAMRGGAPAVPGNPMQMVQAFQQFKRGFQGNPEAQVKQMLSSGQMSREQFQQLSQMANAMQSMLR